MASCIARALRTILFICVVPSVASFTGISLGRISSLALDPRHHVTTTPPIRPAKSSHHLPQRTLIRTATSVSLASSGVIEPGCSERVFELDDLKLAARVWGDPAASNSSADNWIALHGWADSAASFDLIAPLLLEKGAACVVALDFCGHGFSGRRKSLSYHDTDMFLDVVRVGQALGWEKFSLLGHSYGGCVAQAVASTVPERISRLLILEALGFFSKHPHDTVKTLRRMAEGKARQEWIAPKTLEACARRRARQNVAGALPLEAARVLVSRGAQPSPSGTGFVWSADPRVLNARLRWDEAGVRNMMAGISCPHAVVVAEDGLFARMSFGLRVLSPLWALAALFGTIPPSVPPRCTMSSSSSHPSLMLEPIGVVSDACDAHLASLCAAGASAHVATAAVHFAIYFPFRARIKADVSQQASLAARAKFAFFFAWRYLLLRTLRVIRVDGGGHHMHLCEPEKTVEAVSGWLEETRWA